MTFSLYLYFAISIVWYFFFSIVWFFSLFIFYNYWTSSVTLFDFSFCNCLILLDTVERSVCWSNKASLWLCRWFQETSKVFRTSPTDCWRIENFTGQQPNQVCGVCDGMARNVTGGSHVWRLTAGWSSLVSWMGCSWSWMCWKCVKSQGRSPVIYNELPRGWTPVTLLHVVYLCFWLCLGIGQL